MFKLRASTLIEVLVAMVIISISFGIAMMIVMNLLKAQNNKSKIEAYFIANNIISQIKPDSKLIDEQIDFVNLYVEKTVTSSTKSKNIAIISVKVFDKTKRKIFEKKTLQIIQLNEKIQQP